jgi:hypothetical protein
MIDFMVLYRYQVINVSNISGASSDDMMDSAFQDLMDSGGSDGRAPTCLGQVRVGLVIS